MNNFSVPEMKNGLSCLAGVEESYVGGYVPPPPAKPDVQNIPEKPVVHSDVVATSNSVSAFHCLHDFERCEHTNCDAGSHWFSLKPSKYSR